MSSFIVFIKHFVSIAHPDKLLHYIPSLIHPQIHMDHIQEDEGPEKAKKRKTFSSALRVHRGRVPLTCRTSLITRKWGRKDGFAWGRRRPWKRRCNLTLAPGKSLLCPDSGRERKDQWGGGRASRYLMTPAQPVLYMHPWWCASICQAWLKERSTERQSVPEPPWLSWGLLIAAER